MRLYHATEITANQNTETQLYIRRYNIPNLPIVRCNLIASEML